MRELQNEKFLPTVGFEPPTFRLRSRHPSNYATRFDANEQLKINHAFPVLLHLPIPS